MEGIILHKLLTNIMQWYIKNNISQYYLFHEHKDDSMLGNQSSV